MQEKAWEEMYPESDCKASTTEEIMVLAAASS